MFKQAVKGCSSVSLLLLAASIQAATPNAPVISWMPTDYALQNGSVQVPLRWDMWWGSNGNKWYLHKNDSVVYEAALTPNGQNAQSGSTSLSFTQPGSYQLQVSLCDVSGSTEHCAQSGITTVTITGTGGSEPDPVEPDPVEPDPVDPDPVDPDPVEPDNPVAPAKPTFAWSENSVTLNGGSASLNLAWNMWWGNNGNLWQLKQNGTVVHSASLSSATPAAQSGSTNVSFNTTGNYNFVVSLCQQSSDALLCTDSDVKTVAVTAGSGGGDGGGDGVGAVGASDRLGGGLSSGQRRVERGQHNVVAQPLNLAFGQCLGQQAPGLGAQPRACPGERIVGPPARGEQPHPGLFGRGFRCALRTGLRLGLVELRFLRLEGGLAAFELQAADEALGAQVLVALELGGGKLVLGLRGACGGRACQRDRQAGILPVPVRFGRQSLAGNRVDLDGWGCPHPRPGHPPADRDTAPSIFEAMGKPCASAQRSGQSPACARWAKAALLGAVRCAKPDDE